MADAFKEFGSVNDVAVGQRCTRHVGYDNSKPGPKFNPEKKLKSYLESPVEAGRPIDVWQRYNATRGRNETIVDFICRVCGEMGQQIEHNFRNAVSCGCEEAARLDEHIERLVQSIPWRERRDIAESLQRGSQHHWVADHFGSLRNMDSYNRRLVMSRIWSDWKYGVIAEHGDDRKRELWAKSRSAFMSGDRNAVAAIARSLHVSQSELSVICRWGDLDLWGISINAPERPDLTQVHLRDNWSPKMFKMPVITPSTLKSIRAMIESSETGDALSEFEIAKYKKLWAALEREATREERKIGQINSRFRTRKKAA